MKTTLSIVCGISFCIYIQTSFSNNLELKQQLLEYITKAEDTINTFTSNDDDAVRKVAQHYSHTLKNLSAILRENLKLGARKEVCFFCGYAGRLTPNMFIIVYPNRQILGWLRVVFVQFHDIWCISACHLL